MQLDFRHARAQGLQPRPRAIVDGDEEMGVEVRRLHHPGPRIDEELQVGAVLRTFEQPFEMIEHEQQARPAVPSAEGRQVRGRDGFGEVDADSHGRRRFVERAQQRFQRCRGPLLDDVKQFALAVALNATAPLGIGRHHRRRAARLRELVADAVAQQRQHASTQQRRLADARSAHQHGEPRGVQGTHQQLRLGVEVVPVLAGHRRRHTRHQSDAPLATDPPAIDRPGMQSSPERPCISTCQHPA